VCVAGNELLSCRCSFYHEPCSVAMDIYYKR
jgi:hypothetical protein